MTHGSSINVCIVHTCTSNLKWEVHKLKEVWVIIFLLLNWIRLKDKPCPRCFLVLKCKLISLFFFSFQSLIFFAGRVHWFYNRNYQKVSSFNPWILLRPTTLFDSLQRLIARWKFETKVDSYFEIYLLYTTRHYIHSYKRML